MECAIKDSLKNFYKTAVLPLKKAAPGAYASRTILWEGVGDTDGQVLTLNDAYTNYDYIIGYMDNGGDIAHTAIGSTTEAALRLSTFTGTTPPEQKQIWLWFTTSTSVTLQVDGGGWFVRCLEGIKFYPNPNDYSTTEKAIGKWIDGKTLYQRTFTGTHPTAAGSLTVATIPDIKVFFHSKSQWAWLYNGEHWQNVPESLTTNLTFNSTTKTVTMTVDSNILSFIAGSPYAITLQYTKN